MIMFNRRTFALMLTAAAIFCGGCGILKEKP